MEATPIKKELWPVAVLPWLELHDRVEMGQAVFWPYEKLKGKMLPPSCPASWLDKYARMYRGRNGEQANVALLSYPSRGDRKLTVTETIEVYRARLALFATAYLAGLADPESQVLSLTLPSSDHFAMHDLPMAKGLEEAHLSLRYPRRLIFGSIENWRIDQPIHLFPCTPRFFLPFQKVLSRALGRRHSGRLPYVWRAIEWFFYSHTAQEHFTEDARLVTLCMAIEAAIEECENRREFIQKVAGATGSLGLPRRFRRPNGNTGQKDADRATAQLWTAAEVWACDFYTVRRNLVHSKVSKPAPIVWSRAKKPIYHSFLASYVWFECLWQSLLDHGLIPPAPVAERDQNDLRQYLRYSKWHRGWLGPVDTMRDRWFALLTGRTRPRGRRGRR